eukprot:scaffold145347_cov16-Tisochrysis_lutea.AAC.1
MPGDAHGKPNPKILELYAIGDCCANPSHPLPALAQVAEQQGRYLAASLNYEGKADDHVKS